jgi:hypothetical protein
MTRGERNHNPLNIRRNKKTRWLGQAKRQCDREFVQFQSLLFGFRAAFRILRTYIKLHELTTLKDIIYRWAPPEDGNNTLSYIDIVSERSMVKPCEQLTFEDEQKMVAIVCAMAWVESRMGNIDVGLVKRAYLLAV